MCDERRRWGRLWFGRFGRGVGNKLVRSSSAVCNAITSWLGPFGSSSMIVCRSRDRPEVASAIHTSIPRRDGSIRTAATACAARALASIDPCGARTMTSSRSEVISALIRAVKGSAGLSVSKSTTRRESGAVGGLWVWAWRGAGDKPPPTTPASTSQRSHLNDPFTGPCARWFTWRGYLVPRPRRGPPGTDAGIAPRSCERRRCHRTDGALPSSGRKRRP